LERKLEAEGYVCVAGVDEAGRGSLFGPVFAAAVILPACVTIEGIRDSKQLPPTQRSILAHQIAERATTWAVASATAEEIDRINILQASRLAMKRAILMLDPAPDYLLIDAVTVDLPVPQQALIKGDARCRCIAAASILAKVHRDKCMHQWDATYPQYGLSRSKGYPTPEHLLALKLYGPTPFHRLTYEPVRKLCSNHQLDLRLTAGGEVGRCP